MLSTIFGMQSVTILKGGEYRKFLIPVKVFPLPSFVLLLVFYPALLCKCFTLSSFVILYQSSTIYGFQCIDQLAQQKTVVSIRMATLTYFLRKRISGLKNHKWR